MYSSSIFTRAIQVLGVSAPLAPFAGERYRLDAGCRVWTRIYPRDQVWRVCCGEIVLEPFLVQGLRPGVGGQKSRTAYVVSIIERTARMGWKLTG